MALHEQTPTGILMLNFWCSSNTRWNRAAGQWSGAAAPVEKAHPTRSDDCQFLISTQTNYTQTELADPLQIEPQW